MTHELKSKATSIIIRYIENFDRSDLETHNYGHNLAAELLELDISPAEMKALFNLIKAERFSEDDAYGLEHQTDGDEETEED